MVCDVPRGTSIVVFPQPSAAQGLGHLFEDCLRSGGRLGGLSNRATDDQVTGSATQGFSGSGDALLVGGICPSGPDAGNCKNRFRAGEGANPGYFPRRADEAAQAGVEGHPGQELDLIGGLPRNAHSVELRGVHAGEDGYG